MEKIRVLQVVPNMQKGGLENLIMNIYRNIDKDKIQFDFLVHYNKYFEFYDEIQKLGGKIYIFPLMDDKNVFKYIHELNKFFKNHKEYRIIHGHMASIGFLYLYIAKKNNIPVRIAHSHGASHLKTLKGYIKNFLFKFFKIPANYYMACSSDSGKYMFGEKIKFDFIPNAIDVKKYKFDNNVRKNYRKKLGISSDEFVIGNIGRFNLQKNHKFLVESFFEFQKKVPNSRLLLIGEGELLDEIKNYAKKIGINNKIIFTGGVSDTWNYYNVMDVFALPSLFEGLPVVGVEAQANGLEFLLADNVTSEVIINKNVNKIEIDSINKWVEALYQFYSNYNFSENDRIELNKNVYNSSFNIKHLSYELQKKYEKLYNKNN